MRRLPDCRSFVGSNPERTVQPDLIEKQVHRFGFAAAVRGEQDQAFDNRSARRRCRCGCLP
jgi:hypothetical protein